MNWITVGRCCLNNRQGKTQVRRKGNAEFNLQIDAYLPSDYISDERQKIEIYKRIREIENQKDYQDLQDELIDRFGEYPDQVAYLIEIGLVKAYLDAAFAELSSVRTILSSFVSKKSL